jgi:hypothetical protein
MNRLIIAIGLVVYASFNGLGQGTGVGIFDFTNAGSGVPEDRKIYVGEFLTGPKASGPGYQIAIFYGPPGTTDENALVQVGNSTGFLTDPGHGQFLGGARTVFNLDEDGGVIALQARAWDASSGHTTWAQAAADPVGQVGKGPIFQMATKDPFDFGTPNPPTVGSAAGWIGFAITPVPEPSTWALAGLGVAGLLVFRRLRR